MHTGLLRSGRASALAAMLLIVVACGSTTPPASDSAGANPADATPSRTPSLALATPDTVDGIPDDTLLVPPDPETGEVPAAVPAPGPVTGVLTLGSPTALLTGSVDDTGGTLTAAVAGHPLDGLAIEVPAGTYSSAVAFTVSARPIGASTFDGLTAASPLLRIENGGIVTNGDPVRVTIPAKVPAGASVSAFYYDEDTGTLASLPIVEQGDGTVTIAAEHFSDLWLALVDWTKIGETVDSGFRPGQDDWQFPNYGSFVAPAGHCEGQSVSAIWYYKNKRQAGASPLYGLYDNNGAGGSIRFWQDDSDGYRFASSVQADPIAIPKVYSFAMGMSTSGTLTYDIVRAAIGLTGDPQLIAITDSAGGHGHAIVAYRVGGNRIYVADPNYPARLRTIKFDPATGVLGPYSSGDSAGSIATNGAVSYTRFALIPASASVASSTVADHWAEFEDNKSGAGAFPGYKLDVFEGLDEQGNDKWASLSNGYDTPDEKIRVRLTPTGAEQLSMAVFKGTDSKAIKGWGTDLEFPLKTEGANDIGFHVMGVVDGAWRYVDFERLTINRGLIDINGTWTGTFVFTDITADKAALADAEKQGCNIAILEELRDQPLPVTISFTADEAGEGSSVMVIDVSVLPSNEGESDDGSDPVKAPITYRDGMITFDLGATCGEYATCTETAVVTRVDAKDRIVGVLKMAGEGYSATAEWTIGRAEDR